MVSRKTKPAPKKAKKADPVFPSKPKSFRIGQDILPKKRDLGRYVRWPRYVRLQRQKKILLQRLKVPPSINQFSNTLDKSQATALFKLLFAYKPETKKEKQERLKELADAKASGGAASSEKPKPVIKFGLHHVTTLVEEKKAKLVVIASDVDPLELVLWLPALCRKMDVPYCIVKSCARVGALVGQKTATAVCLTKVNKADENELRTLSDAFQESFTMNKLKWTRDGKPIMGLKTQMRLKKRQEAIEMELAKRNKAR